MFQLLQPLMLFSLLGLAIPVAIHLWNRKRGQRIKVGSIALLKETQSRRMSSIRMNEVGLLLVRCLLLAVLALLLAGPRWLTTQNKRRTWVLVSPELLSGLADSTGQVRRAVDTLLKSGSELRMLTKDFPAFSLQNIPVLRDTVQVTSEYWSLLRELDWKLPAQTSVVLLTAEKLHALRGSRPTVNLDVQWLTFDATRAANHQLVDAYLTSTDSIRVQIGKSSSEGNSCQTLILPVKAGVYPAADNSLKLTNHSTQWQVSLAGGPATPVDTNTYSLAIYAGKNFAEDARYVRAACEAIAHFTKRKITIDYITSQTTTPRQCDWLFWLSRDSLPKVWLTRTTTVLTYPTKAANHLPVESSWLQLPQPLAHPVRLYQGFSADLAGEAIWRDGYGRPVLTFSEKNKAGVYRFSSRFHPEWNDLVWHEAFPEVLLSLFNNHLWLSEKKTVNQYDQRRIDVAQLFPQGRSSSIKESRQVPDVKPLREPLWLLALVLFVAERWVTGRTRKQISREIAV